MIRLLLFFVVVTIAAIALSSVSDMPGDVSIHWMGWQINTTMMFMLFAVGALILLFFVLYRVLEAIVELPVRFRHARSVERHERGLSVLTEAFSALAVSDLGEAKKLTRKASKLLDSPPITHLLAAQLARLEGDVVGTTAHLTPLLEHKETRFLAARGLLEQARQTGDIRNAINYAEQAEQIRPDSHYAVLALIDLYTHEQRWQEAINAIRRGRKYGAITSAEAKRYTALVEYQHAQNLFAREEYDTALRFAKSAHKGQPEMVAINQLLMKIHAKLGQKRQIPAVVARAWKLEPHPSLALYYKKLFMDEPPARRLKRMEALASNNPDDIESHIAVAEAALDDNQFELARTHLKAALAKQETQRLCKLMARLEETQHRNKEKADEWMERAARASAGPAWTCGDCKSVTDKWRLHCPECDGFDTVTWRTNRLNYVQNPQGALIAG